MADYNELFTLDSADKQLKFITDDELIEITNEDLYENEFELNESICSESSLVFGSCESTSIKFRIAYTGEALKGKWLNCKISINGNEDYNIGRFKVYSDSPTSDRRHRDIVAYDVMYDILNSDVAQWYNTLLPGDDSYVTMRTLRDSFFNYLGVTQETINLPQDSILVRKTINKSELSGKTVITAICELNGCFGHIGRDGLFQYVFLDEIDEENTREIQRSDFIEAQYQDYEVSRIDAIRFKTSDYVYGEGDNVYTIADNFLIYNFSNSDLDVIGTNLFPYISVLNYRPCTINARGNLTINVGDSIKVETEYATLYTYIAERTYRGIQAVFDEYISNGEEIIVNDLNSTSSQMTDLKDQIDKNELTFNQYSNSDEIQIEDEEKTIIDIRFSASSAKYVIFQAEILTSVSTNVSGVTYNDVVAEVTYELNGYEIDSYHPRQTLTDGEHVISLMYIVPVNNSIQNIWKVKLNVSDGTMIINIGNLRATIYGQGVYTSFEWNGFIEVEEETSDFTIPEIHHDEELIHTVNVAFIPIIQISKSETTEDIQITEIEHSEITTDSVFFGEHASSYTWSELGTRSWVSVRENFIWG